MVVIQMEYDYLFHAAYNHVNLGIHLFHKLCHTLPHFKSNSFQDFYIRTFHPSSSLLVWQIFAWKFTQRTAFVNKVSRYCRLNAHYLLPHSKKKIYLLKYFTSLVHDIHFWMLNWKNNGDLPSVITWHNYIFWCMSKFTDVYSEFLIFGVLWLQLNSTHHISSI